MDRGAWRATVHGVTKSCKRLERFSMHIRWEEAQGLWGSLREQAEELSEPRLCSLDLSSLHLQLLPEFKSYLLSTAKKDLSNGGRGIGNLVESQLINPLANVLVSTEWQAGDSIVIENGPAHDKEDFSYHFSRE